MPFHVVFLALLQLFPTPRPSPVPTPTPTPSPTPEPLNVATHVVNNDASPIYISRTFLRNGYRFTFEQCLWFRNVSTKVATEVDFSFHVTNHRGETEAQFGFLDKGTFTPPINIDKHCLTGPLWPKRVVRRMTNERVHVKAVTFADGSTWKPGVQFMRAYTNGGQRLAEPIPDGRKALPDTLPPAQSTTPLAAGSLHGAIFYAPGSFASGSAVDRPTIDMARTDARSACNAQTAGRNDCRLGIEFSTLRCGALGVLNGQVEYGVGNNERDARAMVLGKIPGAQIITVTCNASP